MKQKIFNSIIILICSTFLITIIATSCILYSDYKIGLDAAQKRYEKLFNQTESAIVKYGYPNSDFIAAFNLSVGSLEYYNSITLKNSDQVIYDYVDSSNQLSSIFTTTKSSRLTEGENIDITLTVSIYTLSSAIIFSRTKVAFIIILATTLLSILCLIYVYLNNSSSNSNKTFSFESKKDTVGSQESFDDEISFDVKDPIDENTDEHNNESTNNTDLDYSDEQDEVFDYESNDLNLKKSESSDSTSIGKIQATSTSINESEKTSDLFSSDSGFCYEKFLITRLESELARASSGELDLSLILISIPNIKLQNDCGLEICKKVLDFFHYRDMIFEYKQDGIAIIHSNADINASMEIAESLYVEIASVLSKFEVNSKPYFGIASRSLRFISGDRLLTEAQQALLHAKEDEDSQIIAFRVNPEKYRQYVATKEEN